MWELSDFYRPAKCTHVMKRNKTPNSLIRRKWPSFFNQQTATTDSIFLCAYKKKNKKGKKHNLPFIFVQKEIGFCPIKVIFDKWQHQQCTLSRIRLYSSIYYISLGNFMQIPILVQYRIHCSCSSLKWHVACGYYM